MRMDRLAIHTVIYALCWGKMGGNLLIANLLVIVTMLCSALMQRTGLSRLTTSKCQGLYDKEILQMSCPNRRCAPSTTPLLT
ncbi:uncharacterized protein BYT42DRAFT_571848 [Radiomyces spectabilis]|uniref:uncharacterized protein n=1 Tax=Radiomyces spectabilis TaxID=64574 RepID=UPI00221FA6F7|nr:uncharacterized protein BYT42DRAFT_571848 [Radiomyces spectabilis]KAI8377829.1 hypothetical protein BYT42DRAFT_571848 [Radiomyces spectabilis]